MTYTLTRTRADGTVIRELLGNVATAGQRVAWCAADNLEASKADAAAHGVAAEDAFKAGEPYELGPYTFELTRGPIS